MKKVLKNSFEAGSQEQNEPRLFGSIVEEMLLGNSPLAKGYRQYIASRENGEAEDQGSNRNTELGVNLKTFLRSDKRMLVNKEYPGILRLDSQADIDEFRCCDPHMTFYEAASKSYVCHRNVHLYEGRHITCTKRLNGSLRLNFKNLKLDASFSVDGYALEVANEIRNALKGLVEEK
jgi:hypothetical protein